MNLSSSNNLIIFCKCKTGCAKLYTFFQVNMGPMFMEPPGASQRIIDCRMVDMFFKGTERIKLYVTSLESYHSESLFQPWQLVWA